MTERRAPPHHPDDLAAAFRLAVDHALGHASRGADAPAFRRSDPGALDGLSIIPAVGRPLETALRELIANAAPFGMDTGHPRFFAFIPSPASPAAWLGDLVAAVHNRHAGSAVQAEGAAAIERGLIRFLCEAAGFPDGSGGLFVSGGSMANLAGLCVARDAKLAEDERPRGTVYLTRETHASVARALRILGLPDNRIRVVAVDAAGQMDVAALSEAIAADRASGLKPFAIAASAGATNTGAIDPLNDLADLCEAEGLWLHVDGAYGASALLSPAHKDLLAGVERADSLAWDAHKWLFQTYGCGAVLLRDRSLMPKSFALSSDYLRDGVEGLEPNFWDMGPELTRPDRGARLWLTLQTMGREGMARAISHGFALAETAEREVRAMADWEVCSPARMAIVCFRYAPEGLASERADAANAAAARRLMDEGFAVVGTTRLDGRVAIRLCTINPATSPRDIRETLAKLDEAAREIASRAD